MGPETVTSTKRLNRLLEAPGRVLEAAAGSGWGAVLNYTGPVPCEYEFPEASDFEQIAWVDPPTFAAWFCLREYPRRSEPNGPFCSCWHVRGADSWAEVEGKLSTPDGWFLVDVAARTITERLSGKTMTEAEVFAGLANPPHDLKQGMFLRAMAQHLMALLPEVEAEV